MPPPASTRTEFAELRDKYNLHAFPYWNPRAAWFRFKGDNSAVGLTVTLIWSIA
jgi:hypothetical protein